MASARTEKPTNKRIREAYARGDRPTSRDFASSLSMALGVAVLFLIGDEFLDRCVGCIRQSFRSLPYVESVSALGSLTQTTAALASFFWLIAGSSFVVLVVASLAQAAPFFGSASGISKRWSLFSERHIVSRERLVQHVWRSLVFMLVACFCLSAARDCVRALLALMNRPVGVVLSGTALVLLHLTARAGAVLLIASVVDVFFQRWRFVSRNRMSREERMREQREGEMSRLVRFAQKRFRRDQVLGRAVGGVRDATLIVVSPSRFAVALVYDERAGDQTPWVLAKARDEGARALVSKGEGAPVFVEPELSRDLFHLSIGDSIPSQHHEALARLVNRAIAGRPR